MKFYLRFRTERLCDAAADLLYAMMDMFEGIVGKCAVISSKQRSIRNRVCGISGLQAANGQRGGIGRRQFAGIDFL